MSGTARVLRADSRHLPLADNSVDLVITSPPYFALRSYQDGGEHYAGQIGDEATPDEFVSSLLEVTAECVRVLKPSGSLWVNLGDKYAGSRMDGSSDNGSTGSLNTRKVDGEKQKVVEVGAGGQGRKASCDVRPKSLIGIPWRYALRCIDDLGLILRAEVIWSKPNGLPESVTDRVRRSHEQWFHFTLAPRYFSAVDEIREAHENPGKGLSWEARKAAGVTWTPGIGTRGTHMEPGQVTNGNMAGNPLGKLPGSVWTIPTEPLRVPDHLGVDHFAAFPTEWPRRIIAGWSPAGVCTACGEGRRPVTLDVGWTRGKSDPVRDTPSRFRSPLGQQNGNKEGKVRSVTGYVCACPEPAAPTTPSVILDPFGGTGTTALVAKALGRHGISVDMSADYCRLAEWRVNDPGELAKAARVEKPPPQVDGQGSLLDLFGEGIA